MGDLWEFRNLVRGDLLKNKSNVYIFSNQVEPEKNFRIYNIISGQYQTSGPNLSVIECAVAQIVPNFMS